MDKNSKRATGRFGGGCTRARVDNVCCDDNRVRTDITNVYIVCNSCDVHILSANRVPPCYGCWSARESMSFYMGSTSCWIAFRVDTQFWYIYYIGWFAYMVNGARQLCCINAEIQIRWKVGVECLDAEEMLQMLMDVWRFYILVLHIWSSRASKILYDHQCLWLES